MLFCMLIALIVSQCIIIFFICLFSGNKCPTLCVDVVNLMCCAVSPAVLLPVDGPTWAVKELNCKMI